MPEFIVFQPEVNADGFEDELNVKRTGAYAQEFGAGLILERESLPISWFLRFLV